MRLNWIQGPIGRLLFMAALPATVWCSAAQGQQFSVIDLGSLGGQVAGGFGVNTNRLVVGYSARADAGFHGFAWDGIMHDLLPLAPDTQSHFFDINDLGSAVGVSYELGGLTLHALLWEAGVSRSLGDFEPRGINNGGLVVGYTSYAANGLGWVDRACVLSGNVLLPLGTLGGSFSYAYDVNGSNQIVGMSYITGDSVRRACSWHAGQVIDLGTLGGMNSQAYAVNAAGQVVGVADTDTGVAHAFLYQLGSTGQVTSRTDLGELGGGYSYAYGINSLGEVVGTSGSRAFYRYDASMVDLTQRIPVSSGWILNTAMAINDSGAIVGQGTYLGWPRAFLLTPAAPDYDADGDVDQKDFAHFQRCYSGPGVPEDRPDCWDALLAGDNSVDLNDFAIFQKCSSGPNVPVQADCWR